jgi:hypothetical protein
MWTFKTKRNTEGQITKHKARLVALGNTQKYGIDYEETFSPVIQRKSLRTLIANAAIKGWDIHTLDIDGAYLIAEIEDDIYMEPPEGIEEVRK